MRRIPIIRSIFPLPVMIGGVLLIHGGMMHVMATEIVQATNAASTDLDWNDASVWGATPISANTYKTAAGFYTAAANNLGVNTTGRVRESGTVFSGSALTIVADTELLLKNLATTSNGNVVLNGGSLRYSPNSTSTATLSGTLNVASESYLGTAYTGNITLNVNSTLTGSAILHLAAGGAYASGGGSGVVQTISLGGDLSGFSGTLDIGGGKNNSGQSVLVAAQLDFNQNYYLPLMNIVMGTRGTPDRLRLDQSISVKSFKFGTSTLAGGTYTAAALNALYGSGSQFVDGGGTLTVIAPIPGDTDGDGLPDSYEYRIIQASTTDAVDGLEDVAGPLNNSVKTDFDGDGLSDADEYANGIVSDQTDPTNPDSDGDGIPDGNEKSGKSSAGIVTGFGATDPNALDSDMDGYGDAVEIAAGSNPVLDTSVPAGNPMNPRSLPVFSESALADGFDLLAAGSGVPVIHDAADAEVVSVAAGMLADDIQSVSGIRPVVATSYVGVTGKAILVGTMGKSPLIDGLISAGKVDAGSICGNWECYRMVRVMNPLPGIAEALVIVGSDRRGTAYGLGAISESMGVSPWKWWADVPAPAHPEIHLGGFPLTSTPASVRYRGIFINDEDWGLQPWAASTFEPETNDIGPKTYGKVFELLLRMRANYCWPAMHSSTRAFYYYTNSKLMADRYAIVMGSSHAEPMLRNNVDEWDRYTTANSYSSDWNYSTNKTAVYNYWDSRAQEVAGFENIYTIGKRGIHDSGMVEGSTTAAKATWLNTIVADQRQILSNRVKADASRVPQIFVPYKEVLDIYDTGGVNLPADVTLVWPDDNYGYIRRLSNSVEQQRKGGGGVYYHLSYWGDPQDYLWLSSTAPSLIWEEMTKAYENRCKRLWVFNVGDIKPSEISLEFAMRLAWSVGSYGADAQMAWLKEWAGREFGADKAAALASMMNEYYRLTGIRKPEHMNWKDQDAGYASPMAAGAYSLFSQVHEGDELSSYMMNASALRKRVDAIQTKIPATRQDAFYQLAVYPIRGFEAMTRKFGHTSRAYRAIAQKRTTAATHSAQAQAAYNEILSETDYYNHGVSGGKWNHLMDCKPRSLSVFDLPAQPTSPGSQSLGLGVAVEGKMEPVFANPPADAFTAVNLNAVSDAVLTAPMQATTLDGLSCTWTPGSGVTAALGSGGRADYSFTLPQDGSYIVSFLVRTPNSSDDSWYIGLDGATGQIWNNLGTSNPVGWRWQQWSTATLTSGAHTLSVYQREDGAAMAAIRIAKADSVDVMGEDARFSSFRLPEFNSVTRRSCFVDLINTGSSSLSWSAATHDPWVVLSNNAGTLTTEQRLNVTIDWENLPLGENLTSNIDIHQGDAVITIPVHVWNPGTATVADFVEENGAVVMDAAHYTSARSGTAAAWIPLQGLGRGETGMIVKPSNAPSIITTSAIQTDSPCLEYSFHLRTPGSCLIQASFMPTLALNSERGRRYAVSVDDQVPVIVSLSSESGTGDTWSRSVVRGEISGYSTHTISSSGVHRLKIWMVDPGLIFQRASIQTTVIPYTYLGLRETSAYPDGTLYIGSGETRTLDADAARYRRIINEGTLQLRGSQLQADQNLTNFGTVRIYGSSIMAAGSSLENFGLMDSMSWQNPSLPNYLNVGSSLSASDFRLSHHWKDSAGYHLRLNGYAGHSYKLQQSSSLNGTDWSSVGGSQSGTGTASSPATLDFTAPATAPRMFYRVVMDESP